MRKPAELGYRMPAEWEPHTGTWLSWPKYDDTFPGQLRNAAEDIYAQFIGALQKGEKVFVLVDDAQAENRAREILEKSGAGTSNVDFYHIPSVDVWTRDYGPTFVINGNEAAAVKWKFNGYGGKYTDLRRDDVAGLKIAEISGAKIFKPRIVVEGGSIDSNGCGTLLTTEQCLLNKNRNPHLTKEQIEKYLAVYTGAENVIWLKHGIKHDDTDGHVDNVARFVSPDIILCSYESDKMDANYEALWENYLFLKNAGGRDKLDIGRLPMPEPILFPKRHFGGPQPTASYANFYIGNSCVITPVFGCKADDEALRVLEGAFPEREIIPIYAVPLVYGGGTFHCVTQQQPNFIK